MIELSNIKLIIWDLDDTFWKGTLSEGGVEPLEKNIQFVKELTDIGIINSVCSKNDKEPTIAKLKEFGIDEYFVFNSIDWTPKGPRIAKMLKDMGLRAVNVLFLDDNITNLNEAKHYSPDLNISEPSIIDDLISLCHEIKKTDSEHKRLKQYKVLEVKQKARATADDNMSFLYSSNTQVEIHNDSLSQIDRITELVNRTNQLNFTKVRSSKEELIELIGDKDVMSGYVTVKDKFGDYGIIGFYALKNSRLIHFLFSCRTIGQGVEQYVYSKLGWPLLEVVGTVINNVDKVDAPKWINQEVAENNTDNVEESHKIILKGACDLSIMSSFLNSNNIVTEFTFVGQLHKNEIEHHNHSVNYLSMPFASEEQKMQILDDCMFCDPEMFNTQMYDKDVDILFLSSLIEPNLGIYRNKRTGFELAFAEYCYPLTDPAMWPKYYSGEAYSYMNIFTENWLKDFSSKWEYIGRMTPERYIENIKKVLKHIATQTVICILLGSEIPYEKNNKLAYNNRQMDHKLFNDALRLLAANNPRVKLIDVNEFITGQDDFTNNINHFQRRIYYKIAGNANQIIAQCSDIKVVQKDKLYLLRESIAARIRDSKIRNSFLYDLLKVPYRLMKMIKN